VTNGVPVIATFAVAGEILRLAALAQDGYPHRIASYGGGNFVTPTGSGQAVRIQEEVGRQRGRDIRGRIEKRRTAGIWLGKHKED